MQPIAEVVSSSVTNIVAQTLASDQIEALESKKKSRNEPAANQIWEGARFGSFVRISCESADLECFAVVHDVVTGPIDGVHRPSAFGLNREQLLLEQPQIFALLRTDLHATIVGYKKGRSAFQHLPPRPPEVHDFVYEANEEDIEAITRDFEFLRLLAAVKNVPADELLAAAVREAYLRSGEEKAFLLKAGQAFAQMFRSDYERLVSVLRKIRPSGPL